MSDLTDEIRRFLEIVSDSTNWEYSPIYSWRGYEGHESTWLGNKDIESWAEELLERLDELDK